VSQSLEAVRQSRAALEAALTRLEQLGREALAAGQDTSGIDLARLEAQAERNRLSIVEAHLEAAAATVELDPAALSELTAAAGELAGLVQAHARFEAVVAAVARVAAAANSLSG
jgi:vacuolar-type H+-ATPase subunit E/Vma4